jgi:hypothetical protein
MAVALKHESLGEFYLRRRLGLLAQEAPFVLRITRWRELTGPVLAVKERMARMPSPATPDNNKIVRTFRPQKTAHLVGRGHIAGEALRRALPVFKPMLSRVRDENGVPLHLERWMTVEGLRQIATLPLDEEAGAKLAIVFRLQERIADLDRVELIARRADRLTREEATYLLSRMTRFDPASNRWATVGLRIMLGGQTNDPGVKTTLDWLRSI